MTKVIQQLGFQMMGGQYLHCPCIATWPDGKVLQPSLSVSERKVLHEAHSKHRAHMQQLTIEATEAGTVFVWISSSPLFPLFTKQAPGQTED